MHEPQQRLRDMKVKDIAKKKRRLVEVPYTATLAHTINTLVTHRIVTVPVAAPPGHWIGAGGSMIMEADKLTGTVRKHYIGMVTMLDILAHIAGGDEDVTMDGQDEVADLDKRLSVPVSAIIGHCLEGLSLWTLNPNTNILDCMEVFSKGIHRAMVPVDSHMDNISGVELVESASTYRMVTQMDVIKFLRSHADELSAVLSRTISNLQGLSDTIFAVTNRTRAIDAIKCMRNASLHAVPIVNASDVPEEAHRQLINGYGRQLVGTLSATDIRGCPIAQMKSWLYLNVMEFTSRVFENPSYGAPDLVNSPRVQVTCGLDSPLIEVIDKAMNHHVHRVWAVNESGSLIGLMSLTDVIRAIRVAILSES